ncbi:MAG: type II toxin-antitoxin system HipA family toxin YjjJ [Bdellovibrionota bacterium]
MVRGLKYQQLLGLLSQRQIWDPATLAVRLEISQPTLSRLLKQAGRDQRLRVIGRARSTRYSGVRTIRQLQNPIPLIRINENGEPELAGDLWPLSGEGWLHQTPEGVESWLHEGMPFYFEDMRPQGFLGRGFSRRHMDLGLPERVQDWSGEHVSVALACRMEDSDGSLILGQESLDRWYASERQARPPIAVGQAGSAYLDLARDALAGTLATGGSSAGGEQPKFSATLREPDGSLNHMLVKFADRSVGEASARWADLLIAESVALECLREAGCPVAETRLIAVGSWVFLESRRFDRVGARGRKGVASLGALNLGFFGGLTNWVEAGRRLRAEGWLTTADLAWIRIADAFGRRICNTDRHLGNLSFFCAVDQLGSERKIALAPIYDMLPMAWAPQGDRVPQAGARHDLEAPSAEGLGAWSETRPYAQRFWERLANDARVSAGFRKIAEVLLIQNK